MYKNCTAGLSCNFDFDKSQDMVSSPKCHFHSFNDISADACTLCVSCGLIRALFNMHKSSGAIANKQVYLLFVWVPVHRAKLHLQVVLCQLGLAVVGHFVNEQDAWRCQFTLQQRWQPTSLHQTYAPSFS